MRMQSVFGLLLIVLGVLALMVRTVTFFTTDRVVGPLGFFLWDVERPHTLFINPLAGIIAIVIGFALFSMSNRPKLA
jgi:hypothetical protein